MQLSSAYVAYFYINFVRTFCIFVCKMGPKTGWFYINITFNVNLFFVSHVHIPFMRLLKTLYWSFKIQDFEFSLQSSITFNIPYTFILWKWIIMHSKYVLGSYCVINRTVDFAIEKTSPPTSNCSISESGLTHFPLMLLKWSVNVRIWLKMDKLRYGLLYEYLVQNIHFGLFGKFLQQV